METINNEAISEETGPILQLKRPLLPIERYAAREGVSIGLLEQCGKLGIVQIRRYKGNTYVVDVPIAPNMPELTGDPANPFDKTERARRIAELVRKTFPQPSPPAVAPPKPKIAPDYTDRASRLYKDTVDRLSGPSPAAKKPAALTDTAQFALPDALEVVDEPAASLEDIDWDEILREMQSAQPQSLDVVEEPTELLDEDIEIQPPPRRQPQPQLQKPQPQQRQPQTKPPQITRAVKARPESFLTKLKGGLTWRVAVVFFLACFFVGLSAIFWLYEDRQVQIGKIHRANAAVKQFVDKSAQTAKQTGMLQNELDTSVAQLQQLKADLENSKAQLKTAQNELTTSRQNLETIRRNNTEAIAKLNERIQRIAELMPKAANAQPPITPANTTAAGQK